MKSSVGLGLRHSFYDYVIKHKPTDIPWFEVISENYLNFGGKPISMLKEVNKNYPLVFHGVSLSIGSTETIKEDYLKKLKNLVNEFNPLWVSDHLCWTYLGAENSHDLLPVPLNRQNLENIISKLLKVQEFLGRKIYLENPSAYVDFNSSEYLEEEFIKEMCQRSGCGLLLDLNNLIVNHYNLGLDPLNYLNTVRNCDVKQIHLAGHSIKENVRIDTHDCEINEEALALLPYAKKLWPHANPMIEWDDKIPPIEDLLQKRQHIQNLWNDVMAKDLPATDLNQRQFKLLNQTDTTEQNLFFSLIKNKNYVTESEVLHSEIINVNLPTPAVIGINVYSSAYYSRQIEVLEKNFPALKFALNDFFEDVACLFLAKHPSIYDSIDFIGYKLADFIQNTEFEFDFGVSKEIISDIARFENSFDRCIVATNENYSNLVVKEFSETDWNNKKIKTKSSSFAIKTNSAIHLAVEQIKNQETPQIPDLDDSYYLFYREADICYFRQINIEDYDLTNRLKDFATFTDLIAELNPHNQQTFIHFLFKNEHLFCCD